VHISVVLKCFVELPVNLDMGIIVQVSWVAH
jgi:hypothetical protein